MPPSTITKTVQTALDVEHYVSTMSAHLISTSHHMIRYTWFGAYGSVHMVRYWFSMCWVFSIVWSGIRRSVIVYGKGVISNCILWSTLQVALLCTELLNEIQFSSVKVSTKSKHGGPVPVLN